MLISSPSLPSKDRLGCKEKRYITKILYPTAQSWFLSRWVQLKLISPAKLVIIVANFARKVVSGIVNRLPVLPFALRRVKIGVSFQSGRGRMCPVGTKFLDLKFVRKISLLIALFQQIYSAQTEK